MLNNARPPREAKALESGKPGEAANDSLPRREHNRFRVDLDVTVTSEHNFYAGFVENLSVGGIFIATHQLKPVGERVEFSVHLPGRDDAILGSGEVRWLRVYSDASNVPPGMGIRFDSLDQSALASIEEFLAQREPLFYDEG